MNALGFAQAGATGAGIGNRESQIAKADFHLGALVSVLSDSPFPILHSHDYRHIHYS
ncbi:hypothetical protein FHR48_000474 [Xanthomonas arboricola]|nr:hypothetical protein [Xanthomonas cannabis]NIK62978.1 hypothetical protein [Xanthomonas cannabis]